MKNFNFPEFNQTNERNSSNLEKSLLKRTDLDGLPITVDFSIGSKEMSIAEITNLASGSIVEIDTEQNIPVKLTIKEKTIGYGSIVIDESGKVFIKIL